MSSVMSAWLPWIGVFVVAVVLPVILRVLVGEDPPANEIRQEQPGDGDEESRQLVA